MGIDDGPRCRACKRFDHFKVSITSTSLQPRRKTLLVVPRKHAKKLMSLFIFSYLFIGSYLYSLFFYYVNGNYSANREAPLPG